MRGQSVRGVKGRVAGMNAFLANNLVIGSPMMGGGPGAPGAGHPGMRRPSPVAVPAGAVPLPMMHGSMSRRGPGPVSVPMKRSFPKRDLRGPSGRRLPSRRRAGHVAGTVTAPAPAPAPAHAHAHAPPRCDPLPPSLTPLGRAPTLPMRSFMVAKGEKLDVDALAAHFGGISLDTPHVHGPCIVREPTYRPRTYIIPEEETHKWKEHEEEVHKLEREATTVVLTAPTLDAYDLMRAAAEARQALQQQKQQEQPQPHQPHQVQHTSAQHTSAQHTSAQPPSPQPPSQSTSAPEPPPEQPTYTYGYPAGYYGYGYGYVVASPPTPPSAQPSTGAPYSPQYYYPSYPYQYQSGW
eukprot:CAMPEP_0174232184 /NCGR_PEP_ID=MMETSP0417-20130205/2542_1 /TAXON_ID=242541 /ORGANISM="Mayorella sp, Strain BSH-02190019" /LENGTH=350 /DNA_ID=CAMNT_0015310193 /DNA_START=153 /DNA_END=1205 /DNA_ORIENTATION=+